ncbi:MAG: cytochrome C oxidase subunit IV family protein [Chloroflexota bacterium]
MLVTVLCLLMLGVSISAAQEDIETTTYEDEENGISFEYPAAWTERFEYEVGAGISIDTFAPDYTTGISVITAPSGEGLNVIERLRLSFYTFADDTEIVDYAGVMLGVITLVEVLMTELLPENAFTIFLLVVLSLAKAYLVIMYYMHLNNDNPLYRVVILLPLLVVLVSVLYLLGVPIGAGLGYN